MIKGEISYFPGCSLATTAREDNQSLKAVCGYLGIRLVELEDWNCCGSSSARSISPRLGKLLPQRNLSLAPPGRPLLVACPSCFLRLKGVSLELKEIPLAREEYRQQWGRPFDPDLWILNFSELIASLVNSEVFRSPAKPLNGLKVATYYGCVLSRPPSMRHDSNYHGFAEKALSALEAEPVSWAHTARCCGTFLSVTHPEMAARNVSQIVSGAVNAGAECILTACAMCHLNLGIRNTLAPKIPVFHFSEILALALGTSDKGPRFQRHLIDPRPLLKSRRLIPP